MRIILIVLVSLFLLPDQTFAQESDLSTFILIRHAEKGKDDPRDPSLSEEGQERAKKLAALLSNTSVDVVLSTPYKRTRQTVQLLAEQKSLEVTDYDPRDREIVNKLVEQYQGKTAVISGHSNTTPFYVNQLLGESAFEQLQEDEYDKIFLVSFTALGEGKVTVLTY